MALFEAPEATWDKRFKQMHYSYRDSRLAPTYAMLEALELMQLANEVLLPNGPWTIYYPFGWTARNHALTGSIFNWPNIGDYASGTVGPRGQCYAREVMVYVTEDTFIRFISLNPIYLTLVAQGYTVAQIAAMGVSQMITEVEHFVAGGDKDTFYPTYATAIAYRGQIADGLIYVSAEGNVEGGE